jgi:transposase
MKRQAWVKAHAMIGVKTNVITSVAVTDGDSHDSPELPALVASTAQRFTMDEVSGDKAYLSHANLKAITAAGATPYVSFKKNSQGDGSEAWRKMWLTYSLHRDEFLSHYHKRSNSETAFSSIKRKFGAAVRSKTYTAQVNEVLCKVLCYNLAVLMHSMHELGVDPGFGVH